MRPTNAVLTTIIFSILEILSFNLHLVINTKLSVMKFRALVSVIDAFISLALIFLFGGGYLFHFFHEFQKSFNCVLATILCFLGPLVQRYFESNSLSNLINNYITEFKSFYQLRAVIIAPFSEEMIYRSFTCSLWESSSISRAKIIILSPVTFGICHFSNFFFLPSKSIAKRLLTCAFQCCYTCVFGWWEAFVWINTHCFMAVFLIHAFCNSMEFPNFNGALTWPNKKQRAIIQFSYVLGLFLFITFVVKIV